MPGLGIDFGTSNSALAVANGDQVNVLRWKIPTAVAKKDKQEGTTLPTVFFVPHEGRDLHVGYEAIEQYLLTGLDGRFIQSIKAFLPSKNFTGTQIHGRPRTIEELIAIFLRECLAKAREQLSASIEGPVVLGRPARFSLDDQSDQLAEKRLLKAAEIAGLSNVRLMTEPLAAARAYEARLLEDQTVMVVDLGGGTSDFTVIAVGPSHKARPDAERVLASGGVPVAGDALDGEIVRAKLLDLFGHGSSYRVFGEPTKVPHWMFKKLLSWNQLSFLKAAKYLDFLREVQRTSDQPEGIARLLRIVEEDLGYIMFRAVERGKQGVQRGQSAQIEDKDYALPFSVTLMRPEFEAATEEPIQKIRSTAHEVLRRAEVTPPQIDAVFMTGGTSLVQPVRRVFIELFGEDKLKGQDTFTSVVDGLARAAHQL
ncbi:MAG: Hsp70 family protein [Myxococcota bacterium]